MNDSLLCYLPFLSGDQPPSSRKHGRTGLKWMITSPRDEPRIHQVECHAAVAFPERRHWLEIAPFGY